MRTPIVVVGAGGFGRETLDVIAAANSAQPRTEYEVLGVVDSGPREIDCERLRARGVPYLGTEAEWLKRGESVGYVIAIGAPAIRARVADLWSHSQGSPVSVVHPSAQIGTQTVIGLGAVVCGGAQISTNVILGAHSHINPNATIGHDAILQDFVSINPGAIISGDVYVDSQVLVGAGATVLQGRRLGVGCVVGASACVTRDVLPGQVVKGIPAK